jgi:hypothetical protein
VKRKCSCLYLEVADLVVCQIQAGQRSVAEQAGANAADVIAGQVELLQLLQCTEAAEGADVIVCKPQHLQAAAQAGQVQQAETHTACFGSARV